jgi:hypothetical protein
VGLRISLGKGGVSIVQDGQLTCSMGPHRMGISIHASKATILSKDFTFGRPFIYILQCCIKAVYFSPLQIENKPREGYTNLHLFLGLLA